LTWLGLQGEVDQLIWQSCLDWVSTTPGKSILSQVLSHWTEGELDPLPGTSKKSSTGQRILQEGGKENCNNFGVSVCVCIRPRFRLQFVAPWLKSYGVHVGLFCGTVVNLTGLRAASGEPPQSTVTRLTPPYMLRGTKVPLGRGQTDI
jgi:hypothetical protein